MKQKLTLLLLALFTTMGAWADVSYTVSNPVQVTDLSSLSDDNFYVLYNAGSSKYNYYDSENTQMGSTASYDYSAVVRLIYDSSAGTVKIQQVCTETYYQTLADGTRVTLGNDIADYAISSAGDNKFFLDNNSLKLNTNNTGNLPQGANNGWTGGFSQWIIYQVDVTTSWNNGDSWSASSGGGGTYAFGVTTPGTTDDCFNLSSFSIYHLTGNHASTSYACISTSPYTGASLAANEVLAISTSAVTPSASAFVEYTLDQTVSLVGGTTYYVLFLSSNVASGGNYTVQMQRVGYKQETYAPGIYWNATVRNDYSPGFSATLTPNLTSSFISVTYELYESDGTTLVESVVKSQAPSSAVSVPASLTSKTYYDYTTEGTIGDSDCTIKVIRTLKTGYVIDLAGLSNSKCYNIRNNRATWAVGSGATVVNSTSSTQYGLNLAFSATDSKQQFAFITYEGNVYLYSVGESKFAYVDGTKLSLTADVTSAVEASPVTFQASTNATYKNSEPIIVTVGGNHFGVSTGFNPNIYKYSPHPEDGGNCAYIIEAGDFDATAALAALEAYFHPSYTVTYIVKDGSNNTLFTSDPVPTTNGANITTLPAEYQRAGFYTYTTVDVTISATGNTNVEFTATPKAEPIVQYTADTTSPYYYNLNIRSKYLVYDSNATGEVTLQNESEPFNENAAWAFIGEPYAGFKVINQAKGTGYDLTYTSVVTGGNGGSDGSNNNVQFVADTDFNNRYWIIETNNGGFCMRMKENTDIYFHHQSIQNSNGYLRTCSVSEWSAVHNDAGSTIVASTDEDVLIALQTALSSITYGTAIGQFSAAGYTAEQVNTILTNAETDITNGTTANYATDYANLQALSAATSLNTPSAGFYRFKNVATDKYLTAISGPQGYTSTTRGIYASNNDGNSVASIIRLYDKNSDGHLYMYNQGYGFGWVDASGANGAGVGYLTTNPDKYVNWFPGNAAGRIALAICLGNGTGDYASYLTKGIYTVDTSDEAVIGGTDYTADAAQWIVEEATSATVTLNGPVDGNYYATLCVPFACTVSGATAYTLALNAGETGLTLSEGTTTIAAGTPVLLKGTSATATLTIGTEYANTPVEETALTGTYLAKGVTGGTDYFLGAADSKVGFYHWNGSTLAANRAYFEASNLTNGNSVKGLVLDFDDDDATGIKMVNGQSSTVNEIYNLAGQRMNKIQKGINIINGKKILK